MDFGSLMTLARYTVNLAVGELEYFCVKHLTPAKSVKVLGWSFFLDTQGFTPLRAPISID